MISADICVSLFWRVAVAVFIAAACAAALLGCSGFNFFVANAPNAFGSFRRSSNLAYGDDARQTLDVYAPKRPERRPVVIFFYGGTWSAGKKSDYAFVGAALAERGYVTVIPDYRLYPEVKFPTFVEDGARAVAWAQQHARDFGGDPDRLEISRPAAPGNRGGDRAALGADAERIGGVLDVDASELAPVAGTDDGADEVARVGRIGARRQERGLLDERGAHPESWNSARVVSAPSRPPSRISPEEWIPDSSRVWATRSARMKVIVETRKRWLWPEA